MTGKRKKPSMFDLIRAASEKDMKWSKYDEKFEKKLQLLSN